MSPDSTNCTSGDRLNVFTCIYFNARGLNSKLDTLEYELKCLLNIPDAICITKTWFCDEILLHGNIWDKYTIYRKDRNKYGGGVAILVNEEFVTLAYDNTISNVEGIACKCVVGDSEVVLCCIYKPPNFSLDLDIAITNYIDNMCNSFTNSRFIHFWAIFNYPNINLLGQIPTAIENVEITFLEYLDGK